MRWQRSLLVALLVCPCGIAAGQDDLVFIHHSVGQNWLDHSLDAALLAKTYVDERNDITYGTDVAPDSGRPDSIGGTTGDSTDMYQWLLWFNDYLGRVKAHGCANGANRIVMFKSCYPASNVEGDGTEPGDPFDSAATLANYRAVYRHPDGAGHTYDFGGDTYAALEDVFAANPGFLFIPVTAPPWNPAEGSNTANARRARTFNNWLKHTWLPAYRTAHPGLDNVAVFDLFDVLAYPDNHATQPNLLRAEYRTGDSHPNATANAAATAVCATATSNFLDTAWQAFSSGGGPGRRPWPDTRDGIHVFADQLPGSLTDAQRAFAASHLVGTQKQLRSEIRALRAYNPDFLCLHYQLGVGAGAHDFIHGDAWTSDWSYVNAQTGWFLRNAALQRVHQTAWNWDVMDVTFGAGGAPHTGFPAYWVSTALDRTAAAENDGVFADSFTVDAYFDACNPTHPWFTDPAASLANWVPSLNAYGTYVRSAFDADTRGFKFLPNLGGLITGWDTSDYGVGHGGMVEGFCCFSDGYFDPADWELQMDRILALARRDKILLFQTTTPANTPAARLFVTASYLLVKGRNTYLNLLLTDDVALEYYPEYDIALGPYTGELPASASALWRADWGVYRRDYRDGFVLVNPGETPVAIASLGTNALLAAASGGGVIPANGSFNGQLTYTAVSAVTLPAHGGAVLRYGAAGGDITPPGNVAGLTAAVVAGTVQLSWTNPTDADWQGTVIQRQAGTYPAAPTAGTRVYSGTGTNCTDAAVSAGMTYYYAAFAGDGATPTNWSAAVPGAQASATVPGAGDNVRVFQDGAGSDPAYTGCADTFLANFQALYQNMGGSDAIRVYVDSSPADGHYRILVRYDLSAIPAGSAVSSATLAFYQYDCYQEGPVAVALHPVTRAWVEGTGTWQNEANHLGASWEEAANGVPWTAAGGDYDTTTDFGHGADGSVAVSTLPTNRGAWVSWDITALVDDWVSGRRVNNGLMVIPTAGQYTEHFFCSADHETAAQRPRLTVTYSAGGPDTTPPAPVANLQARPNRTEVRLSWQNPTAGWTGTRLLWRPDRYPTNATDGTLLYAGTAAACTQAGVTAGATYYYGAYAHDGVPNYATNAPGARATAVGGRDTVPPASVTGFAAAATAVDVRLVWTNPADADFAGTRVCRGTAGYPAAPGEGAVVYAGSGTAATDAAVVPGTRYYYAAFAYDGSNNFAAAGSGSRDSAVPGAGTGSQPDGLAAAHRAGQTFLTWNEVVAAVDAAYRVYRHTAAIGAGNLAAATPLATVPAGSSRYATDSDRAGSNVYFVIRDLGAPLLPTEGLFVNTVHDTGTFFYAVTLLTNGVENRAEFGVGNALATGVREAAADPRPILVRETFPGRGRTYTQFMDYHRWNPTFDGYAYNYHVTVPETYTHARPWPLYLHIEGYGSRYEELQPGGEDISYGFQAIHIWGDEPRQSWYYGHSATWDYGQEGNPTTGPIVNFAEERLLRAVYDVSRDPLYNVDVNRIYAYGESMGGSGALALGMRYPNVFAAVHAGQPMTDYRDAVQWLENDLQPRWGDVTRNLPIENRGRYAAHLARYNGLGVYDWLDHVAQMTNRVADEMAYISFSHGGADDVLVWPQQGQALPGVCYAGRRGFNSYVGSGGHGWMGFMDTPNWVLGDFVFRRDRSFPAFSNASGSGPIPAVPVHEYNVTLEWSCPWNDFAGDILDTPFSYELALRSTAGAQTVTVTPRRLQYFPHDAGTPVNWRNLPTGQSTAVQSGALVADASGLITIAGFQVTAAGNRLRLDVNVTQDADGDGMPDYFERKHGFNPGSGADGGSTDSDGDGAPNVAEFRAGTHPRDALSVFAVEWFDAARIGWYSVPGFRYELQRRAAWPAGAWTNAGVGVTATGRTAACAVPVSAGSRGTYRIRREP